MVKILTLFFLSFFVLSCSKHSLPKDENQTLVAPLPQEQNAPTEQPTATPSPVASATPVPSTPTPTPTPTTTSTPSPTPTPVVDRLELNSTLTAAINTCVPVTLLSKDALGIIAVTSNLTVTLSSSGYGGFFSDANCNASINSVTLLSGQSTSQIYFRSSLGETITLTAAATGLISASTVIEIQGTALLELQPSSFDFGSVRANTRATKTFVLTNSGSGIAKALEFSTLPSPFSMSSSSCAVDLRAQQNCIFDVVFSPTSTGTFSTTLKLDYKSGSSNLSVTLSLTGNSQTPGVSDTSFGTSGSMLFPYTVSTSPSMDDVVFAMKQDSAGKIVAVGSTYNNSGTPAHNDIAITRLNADGTLDTSFNSTGKNKVDFGFTDGARAVAIQGDGKILVGGFAYVSSKFRFAILRLLDNGSLDNTFGTSGSTTTAFTSGAQAMSMVLTSSGKAVLAGTAVNTTKSTFALAKYKTNGTIDNSFGNSGKVFTTFTGSTFDSIQSVVEDPTQGLIVAGYSTISSLNKLALAKYSSNGSLDISFGNAGTLLPSYPGNEAVANAMTLDTSNNIYITGKSTTSGNDNVLVMKFTNTGATDNSFGTMGAVVLDLGSSQDQGTGISIDSVGRILISAKSTNAVLIRLLSNGQLDTSFGLNGKVDALMGGSNSQANSVLIDTNGKILLGGSASNGTNLDFSLSRFLP